MYCLNNKVTLKINKAIKCIQLFVFFYRIQVLFIIMALQWLWSVIWFFVLIIIAWPLGLIAAFLYCLASPFGACCNCIKPIIDFLHKGVQLPYTVASYMVQGKSCGSL